MTGKIYYSSKSDLEHYYKSDRLSQSKLKKLLGGLAGFLDEREPISSEPMEIGSAVDLIVTGKEGAFEEQYYVSDIEIPTGTKKTIIEQVYNNVSEFNKLNNLDTGKLFEYTQYIVSSIEENYWQTNWKLETKLNKIIAEGSNYFDQLVLANGKKIISEKLSLKIKDLAEIIRKYQPSHYYFGKDHFTYTEVYFQLPIYFEYENISCKALPDVIIVGYEDINFDKIIQIGIADLKLTSDSVLNFHTKVKKFRYDIQAAWYMKAVEKHFDINEEDFLPFSFIVKSINDQEPAVEFMVSDNLMEIGNKGRKATKIGNKIVLKEVKGISQLISDYKYYEKTNWSKERILKDRNDRLIIDWDGWI